MAGLYGRPACIIRQSQIDEANNTMSPILSLESSKLEGRYLSYSNIASKGIAESLLLSYIADDAYSIVMLIFDLLNSHLSEPCYRLLAYATVEGVAKHLLTNIACFRRCVVALPNQPFHRQFSLAQQKISCRGRHS